MQKIDSSHTTFVLGNQISFHDRYSGRTIGRAIPEDGGWDLVNCKANEHGFKSAAWVRTLEQVFQWAADGFPPIYRSDR